MSLARVALVPAALVAVALFTLPLLAIVWRTPWSSLPDLLASPPVRAAMGLSLWSSGAALLMAVGCGLPLSVWLASGRSSLRSVVRIAVMLPIVLPPIVGGIALLLAFGRNGIVGSWLDRWFGVALPFTTTATGLAAAYMGMPFFVFSAEAGLRAFDRRYVDAAATLGASPQRRFFVVTIPMVMPSLVIGALLCWARALGEFCATQMFAGSLAGVTRTMPLACAVAMETEPDVAIALSLLLAAVSILVMSFLRHGRFAAR